MKRLVLITIVCSLLSLTAGTVFARETLGEAANPEGIFFELPLCLPGMPADGTCLLFGAAKTVAEMKEAGFPFPMRDLPAAAPPSELGIMPVFVAKINLPDNEPAPIYATFDDAVAETNPVGQIAPSTLRFISYIARQDYNGNPYLQLSTGGWMRASPAAYSQFQGLQFYDNPKNDFGWIVDQTEVYHQPSFYAETYSQLRYREELIQVYNTIEAEGVTWYQIAPDEWVNSLKARAVSLNTTPPEGVDSDRWIEINLFQQTLMVYEQGKLLFATLIATGVEPFYTQPGVFPIYEKKALETMQGSFEADRSDFFYFQDVPWTMYYDQARAMHAAYWRTYFGYPQSHGCVNISPGDARWVFEWANEGDYVWVHDPSGQTPTDKDFYGPGAP